MAFQRRMRALPLAHVRLDGFWRRWQDTLLRTTLPAMYAHLSEGTPRLQNFRRAAGMEEGPHEGLVFDDSDLYKYLEAVAYAVAAQPDHPGAAGVRAQAESMVPILQAAQAPDGYLNTFFQLNKPEGRWRNLNAMHEMYCAGHLIEAGVAWKECLGDDRLLEVGRKFADHIAETFGPQGRPGICGHEEIEIALIRLAEATGEARYRELARRMVELRGTRPSVFEAELRDPESVALSHWTGQLLREGDAYSGEYAQDHAPIREHQAVVGHAVRAMYLYMAAVELADGAGDEALEAALLRVWGNLTKRRMYVTGGIGPSAANEGFTRDFDLPNLTAYAETCAACGLIFWGQRLLEQTGNSEFADVVERALFNGALAGISVDGTHFFYVNPLESRENHARTTWFGCACCPPNIARTLGHVSRYLLGADEDTLYVHIPAALSADLSLGGEAVHVEIATDYPWEGRFTLTVRLARPTPFAVAIRIPEWSEEVESELPGATEEAEYEGGYAVFRRTWKDGDRLTVDLGMRPRFVEADPRVLDDLGRVALTRGPLVYAAEAHDLGIAPQRVSLDLEGEVAERRAKELGGYVELEVDAVAEADAFPDEAYAEAGTTEFRTLRAKLLPYHLWANRGRTHMQVWMRRL